jgi:hypothetical protein
VKVMVHAGNLALEPPVSRVGRSRVAVADRRGAVRNMNRALEDLPYVAKREFPPIVAAANAAFARIERHRKIFRRDWLPFADGVHFVSVAAWETAGRRTRLDGRPDWGDDRVQVAFRRSIEKLPWATYFQGRRALLSALRHIGDDRDRFLNWYDDLPEIERERTGYPETLWRMFTRDVLTPATAEHDDGDDRDDRAATARTDADRVAEVILSNERLLGFCARLWESLRGGRSILEASLREDLGALLDGEEPSS